MRGLPVFGYQDQEGHAELLFEQVRVPAGNLIEIEMVCLGTLKTAWLMDTVGNKHARTEIAAIKVAAPTVALRVIDRAIQVHGGGGVTDDFRWRECTRSRAPCASPTARTTCTR